MLKEIEVVSLVPPANVQPQNYVCFMVSPVLSVLKQTVEVRVQRQTINHLAYSLFFNVGGEATAA